MHRAKTTSIGASPPLSLSAFALMHNVAQNVPVAVDGATADTALFLLLGAIRQFGRAQHSLREGKFNAGLPLSNDPAGKKVSDASA